MMSPSARERATRTPAQRAGAWRSLLVELVRRDVTIRYRASRMGLLWAVLSPLLQLVVFAFVFGTVLQARWNRPETVREDYAIVLFAGLVVFWLMNDCVSRAPALIRAHRQYVTKVVFPLEMLPAVTVLTAYFHALLSFVVLLLAHAALIGPPPWTAVLAPLVLVPFVLLCLGACWTLAALGVYLPDLEQIIGVLLTAMLFVSTVFFPVEAAPTDFALVLYLNPVTWAVDAFRGAVLWGEFPPARDLAIASAIGATTAVLGRAAFRKSQRGFADVL